MDVASGSQPTGAIQLYDTRTKTKAAFVPTHPDHVTMYVCGPTVYNYVHIGNARPAVVFDMLFRLLQRHYPKVTFARNITDIDDKINTAAASAQQTIQAFTAQYIQAYHEDLGGLHCLRPTIEPKATDNIQAMIEMMQELESKGHAYAAKGHLLFDVSSMPDYGSLSNRSQDELLAGARVEIAPYKKNPSDFVLWKPSTNDQPGWESPWGRGRPGWHIECSAMIRAHLGAAIDIHGGGIDLTFPHHENERAQSNCCSGEEFVQVWMHNGYINMAGEKMSKSIGNFVTLRALLEQHQGEVLRYCLLNAHYRAPLEWNDSLTQQAKASLDRFYQIIRDEAVLTPESSTDIQSLIQPIESALCDDLNTPLALSELHQLANQYFKAESAQTKQRFASAVKAAANCMGLLQSSANEWFQGQTSNVKGLSVEEIEAAIASRQDAKTAKDYALADSIRKDLVSQGIILEDSASGTRWVRS